jgi:hypothetical protein
MANLAIGGLTEDGCGGGLSLPLSHLGKVEKTARSLRFAGKRGLEVRFSATSLDATGHQSSSSARGSYLLRDDRHPIVFSLPLDNRLVPPDLCGLN